MLLNHLKIKEIIYIGLCLMVLLILYG